MTEVHYLFGVIAAVLLLYVHYWCFSSSTASRSLVLSICSVLVIGAISYRHLVLPLILIPITFVMGEWIKSSKSRLLLACIIVIGLFCMLWFKTIWPWLRDEGFVVRAFLPLGLSYFVFKIIHYLIECSRGSIQNAKLHEVAAYILFFPMFLAGPIERFSRFQEELNTVQWCWANISDGLERIVQGVIKKFLISDLILASLLPYEPGINDGEWNADQIEWYGLLFAAFIKFLKIYMDFSGYTDMAIGVGLLFGIRLCENFDFPLLRPNLAEFWRTWHMSLSSWARDYVYFPVLGRYRSPALGLVLTMLTIGLWHAVEPGWFLWGFHHGMGLVVLSHYHRRVRAYPTIQRFRTTKVSYVLGVVAVWWYVSLGHALTFFPASFEASASVYLKLASFGVFE